MPTTKKTFLAYLIISYVMCMSFFCSLAMHKNHVQEEALRECSICFELLEPATKNIRISCGHVFHLECITAWNNQRISQPTCPLCRRVFSLTVNTESKSMFELCVKKCRDFMGRGFCAT